MSHTCNPWCGEDGLHAVIYRLSAAGNDWKLNEQAARAVASAEGLTFVGWQSVAPNIPVDPANPFPLTVQKLVRSVAFGRKDGPA